MKEEVLIEVSEFCEECPSHECCPEEECILFRIEQILNQKSKEETNDSEQI